MELEATSYKSMYPTTEADTVGLCGYLAARSVI